MTAIHPDAVLKQRPGVRSLAVDGGLTLFHPDTGAAYELNPTGASVWALLDGRRSTASLVAELAADYATPPEALVGDVEALLADVVGAGLAETTGTEPGEHEAPRTG